VGGYNLLMVHAEEGNFEEVRKLIEKSVLSKGDEINNQKES
jgi:hypothetical protein